MTCSVRGCTHKHYAKGLCNTHYMRVRRQGSPHIVHDPLLNLQGREAVQERNRAWVGDAAGYDAVHLRLKRTRGRAAEYVCSCGAQATEWAFDEPTGYSTDLSRYTPLCGSCHKKKDRVAA